MIFCHNNRKTGNNAIEMFQPFLNITRFECFTDLTLFRYAFNDIQTGLKRRVCPFLLLCVKYAHMCVNGNPIFPNKDERILTCKMSSYSHILTCSSVLELTCGQ